MAVLIVRWCIHQVEWRIKDGDNVHKGLQFGKVHGKQDASILDFLENFFCITD